MKLDISHNYTKPDISSMSGSDAGREARIYRNDSNYPYMKDLADVILKESDAYSALVWTIFIKEYVAEMFSVINNVNNYNDLETYYDRLRMFHFRNDYQYRNVFNTLLHSNNTLVYAKILLDNSRDHRYTNAEILTFKKKIIELSRASEVVQSIADNSLNNDTFEELLEKFYYDVPEEYKLGVVL